MARNDSAELGVLSTVGMMALGSVGNGHIVVGADRVITVPTATRKIAVQYDHNIETVTFDCPRYWDDIDMSEMKIYVNYRRADGMLGSCLTHNTQIDEDDDTIMHFDWTIKRDVTLIKGQLSILVCIRQIDANGYEENHWNSELCNDLYISEGLECQESVIEQYPDVFQQIVNRMGEIEDDAALIEQYNEMILGANTNAEDALSKAEEALGQTTLYADRIDSANASALNAATKADDAKFISDEAKAIAQAANDTVVLCRDDMYWLNPEVGRLNDNMTNVLNEPDIYSGTTFVAPANWKAGDIFIVHEE